jgi:hypothetical protein
MATTQHTWTEETKAKIKRVFGGEYIFGGEYPIDAIEEVASIIIERDIALKPDKVAELVDDEPWTPWLSTRRTTSCCLSSSIALSCLRPTRCTRRTSGRI